MSARSKARKRALDLLYESDLRGLTPDGTLEQRQVARAAEGGRLNPYTVRVVTGVAERLEDLDRVVSSYAVDWSLGRMPAIDRNLLRLGAFEILHVDDVPDAVAISEAVALAQQLSTEQSARFVNGVLARVAADKASTVGA